MELNGQPGNNATNWTSKISRSNEQKQRTAKKGFAYLPSGCWLLDFFGNVVDR